METATIRDVAKLGKAKLAKVRHPADFLGLGATRGRIDAGYCADFTVVDANLRVTETWIDGVPMST